MTSLIPRVRVVAKALARRASGWTPRRPLESPSRDGPSAWESIWRTYPGDWAGASRSTSGYQTTKILEEVKAAAAAVKSGRAAYARDGVTFDRVEYSWPVLTGLLKAVVDAGGPIDVLDFGGGLGTSYQQNRSLLGNSIRSWSIVEQAGFVNCGNEEFRDGTLEFFDSVEEAVVHRSPHVVLVSGVLQYMPAPYATLAALFAARAGTVILDLLSVTDDPDDCVTIQHVPTSDGWQPAYPTWFFGAQGFAARLSKEYQVVAPFKAYLGERLWIDDTARGRYTGFILRRDDAGRRDDRTGS